MHAERAGDRFRGGSKESVVSSRDWRSESAYQELDTASLRDLAWEYLRRNPDYARDHEHAVAAQSEAAAAAAARTWGLRFRRRSASSRKQRRGLLVGPISPSDRGDGDAGSPDRLRGSFPPLAAAKG
ncbi:transcriptional regulator domain-containing protein [Brevundimonas sp.]|uniref:transcriptional regulator domain-containing protein n=1 Tax=Brevundimonas sp. TaxID=1871086 RepID=UPI0039C88F9B